MVRRYEEHRKFLCTAQVGPCHLRVAAAIAGTYYGMLVLLDSTLEGYDFPVKGLTCMEKGPKQ